MTGRENNLEQPLVLVILGMHRSGTSTLARICNLMGAELGSELMSPGDDNPAGFWENRLIYEFNQRLFAHMGMDWDHPGPIPARGWHEEGMEPFYAEAGDLLREQFSGTAFICIKDPRLSRLLPFWRRVWQDVGWSPSYLFCVRDPSEVVASLADRNGMAVPHAELLWLRYYSDGERNTRFCPRAMVLYEDLLRDWYTTVQRAWRGLGLRWSMPSTETVKAVEEFVQPELRHHSARGSAGQRASAQLVQQVFSDACGGEGPDFKLDMFNTRQLRTVDWTMALLMAEGSWNRDWPVWSAALEASLQGRTPRSVSGDGQAGKSFGDEGMAGLVETLVHRVNGLQASIDSYRGLEKRMPQLEAELQAQGQELEQAQAIVQEVESKLEDSQAEVSKHKNEIKATKRHAEVLACHAMDQEKIMRERQEALEAAVLEQQRLLATRSWRITSPLRRMSGILARVRRNKLAPLRLLLKLVWRIVPLPAGFRWRVRVFLCRRFPSLMRGTWAYSMYGGGRASGDEPEGTGLDLPPATHWPAIVSEPEISVIIPVYNNWHLTAECLASIRKHGARRSFEVVVVDDASTDETARELDASTDLIIVRNEDNLGFIGSCNRGAQEANGNHLVLLNNDTQVHAGWLDYLHETFRDCPEAGLVGAKLLYPDGTLQEAGGIVWEDGNGWNYGRGDDAERPEYNYRREVDYCSGACLMVERGFFHQLGGFDAHYTPAYYEDTDLAFQVRDAGKRVLYQPLARITHSEGGSNGTDPASGIKRHQTINRKRFLRRWEEVLADHGTERDDFAQTRQRGMRGRVLIIDTVTPTPDCDSGSNDAINLMRILTEMSYQVSFIPDDNLAYFGRYTDRLCSLGVECWHVPYLKSVADHLREYGARYDVVILSRMDTAARQMNAVREYCPQAKVVFNTVDLKFLREARLAALSGVGEAGKPLDDAKKKELALMEEADQTWVISPAEQALVEQELPDIEVAQLPLIVSEAETGNTPFQQRRDLFFLGGYQHPPNVDAVEWFVTAVWPEVSASLPEGVCLHIIGSHMPEKLYSLASDNVIVVGFVSDVDSYIANMRLSVAPLRYGAGLKGKVARSLMHGIPCVASSIAAEGMTAEEDHGVTVADSQFDYAALIARLYSDEEQWECASQGARAFFDENYSYAAGVSSVTRILMRLLCTDDAPLAEVFQVLSEG